MSTLKIEINSGKTTCASKPGEFCKFFGSLKFGQIPVCLLFPSDHASHTELEQKDGWVQRCADCLKSEGEKG